MGCDGGSASRLGVFNVNVSMDVYALIVLIRSVLDCCGFGESLPVLDACL